MLKRPFKNSASGVRTSSQRGYTLIELMVSLTLGLLIVASLTVVYVNSSFARNEIEKTSQQTDNGRYALQVLGDDLKNAGYLGEFNPTQFGPLNPDQSASSLPSVMKLPVAKPDPCALDLVTLKKAMPIAVQGYKSSAGLTCITEQVVPNTDVVVVRRASTCAIGETTCDAAVSGALYFQASGCASDTELNSGNVNNFYSLTFDVSALTLLQRDCATVAQRRQFRTHIYYVASNGNAGDGIPTLKRLEMRVTSGAPAWVSVPLVEGVENLQVEYGIDTSVNPTTGSPIVFTSNPDLYLGCAVTKCIEYWANTVAAKLYVLARNTVPTTGFDDGKSYLLGFNPNGTANIIAAKHDAFKRHVFQTVVRLNNPAGRNAP